MHWGGGAAALRRGLGGGESTRAAPPLPHCCLLPPPSCCCCYWARQGGGLGASWGPSPHAAIPPPQCRADVGVFNRQNQGLEAAGPGKGGAQALGSDSDGALGDCYGMSTNPFSLPFSTAGGAGLQGVQGRAPPSLSPGEVGTSRLCSNRFSSCGFRSSRSGCCSRTTGGGLCPKRRG